MSRDDSALMFEKRLFLCESPFSYPRTHQQLQISHFPHRKKQNVMTPMLAMQLQHLVFSQGLYF